MWWMLLACQEPFDEDRHDLSDFRIVGMRLDAAPTALLWSGQGWWHAPAPSLTWADESTSEAAVHTLAATDATGHTETGRLVVSPGADNPDRVGFTRSEADGVWSIGVELDSAATTHFAAPAGSFSETGPNDTTFDPEGATGVLPVVALSFDGLGGNRWDILDLPIGLSPPWLEVDGRIFPTPLDDGAEGWWAVSVEADPGWSGITLVDAAPASGPEEGDPVCGATDTEAFDPSVLAEAVCARDDVVGKRVVVWGTGVTE